MKFTMALVKILSTLVLCGLFGMYIYFAFVQQKNGVSNTLAANISLLLFIAAMAVFSFGIIWLENLNQEQHLRNTANALNHTEKEIDFSLTFTSLIKREVTPILKQLTEATLKNEQTINSGLENLSKRIDNINPGEISITNAESPDFTFISNELNSLTSMVDDINKKSADKFDSMQKNIISSLAGIKSINDIKSQLGNLQETVKNLGEFKNKAVAGNKTENDTFYKELKNEVVKLQNIIKELTEKQSSTAPANDQKVTDLYLYMQNKVSEMQQGFAKLDSHMQDFSGKFDTLLNAFAEAADGEEFNEIQHIPDDYIDDMEKETKKENIDIAVPAKTEHVDAMIPEKTINDIENIIADDIPVTETEAAFQAQNPFGEPVEVKSDMPIIDPLIDLNQFEPDNPFGKAEQNLDDAPLVGGSINPHEFEAENPYGIPTEIKPVQHEGPTTEESLSADNPFGTPVENEKIDPNAEDINKLDKVFNDAFANELSSLEIMQDEKSDNKQSLKSSDEFEDIDLEALLNGKDEVKK